MPSKIQITRGLEVNLPNLDNGELALTIDSQDVYIGDNGDNILVGGQTNNINISTLQQRQSFLFLGKVREPLSVIISQNDIIPFDAKLENGITIDSNKNIAIPYDGIYLFILNTNFLTANFTGEICVNVIAKDNTVLASYSLASNNTLPTFFNQYIFTERLLTSYESITLTMSFKDEDGIDLPTETINTLNARNCIYLRIYYVTSNQPSPI